MRENASAVSRSLRGLTSVLLLCAALVSTAPLVAGCEEGKGEVSQNLKARGETEFYVQPVRFQLAHGQVIKRTMMLGSKVFDAFVKDLTFICDGEELLMTPQKFGIDWTDGGDPYHGSFLRTGDLRIASGRSGSSGFNAPLSFTSYVDGTRITSWGDRKTNSMDQVEGTMLVKGDIVVGGTVDVQFSGKWYHDASFERDNKTVITTAQEVPGTWAVRFKVEPFAGFN